MLSEFTGDFYIRNFPLQRGYVVNINWFQWEACYTDKGATGLNGRITLIITLFSELYLPMKILLTN